jgi:beta-phosphoglucomutase
MSGKLPACRGFSDRADYESPRQAGSLPDIRGSVHMKHHLQAVIFDFNGVIVDDEPLHLALLRQVLGEAALPWAEEDYAKKYLGRTDRACFAQALRDAGRAAQGDDAGLVEQLVARKGDLYQRAIAEQVAFFPGVRELARRLAKMFPLAVASGALRAEIEVVLRRGEIRDCFQAIIAAEDVVCSKPDPEGFVKALAALNVESEQAIQPGACLVIEDSIAGVEAARSAGMRCLAVTNSYPADRLRAADWVASSLLDCAPEDLFTKL